MAEMISNLEIVVCQQLLMLKKMDEKEREMTVMATDMIFVE